MDKTIYSLQLFPNPLVMYFQTEAKSSWFESHHWKRVLTIC